MAERKRRKDTRKGEAGPSGPLMDEMERWEEETVGRALSRHPERKSEFTGVSGRPVERLYTPLDLQKRGHDPVRSVGFPGEPRYTRGIQPTMYRGRLWTMRQYAGFGSARETNQRYHYLLREGQTGLSVAFDLPTQVGIDADDPLAAGEVGKTGVSVSCLEDMRVLMDKIPLGEVSTSMTINAPASVLLAYYIAVGNEQGVDAKRLRGTVQNDILKEYIARGTYIYPPEASLRLTTDIFEYCIEQVPKWNTISVSGYHIREAGATAAQELAFTLADGITYVQAAVDRGLPVDSFAPQISFFFNAHNDFFEEIAKFRAARRMWYKIMTERFGAKDPRSLRLRFHTQTAGSSLTAQQAENNVVRTALQALAATIGGTQSLHTNSMDEALGLPTEKAARIALRTQQVLAEESGVANTVDPFAGSWHLESLTHDLEEEAFALIDRIDQMGGMLKAISSGWVMKQIHESAYEYQKQVESKEKIVVGVNEFLHGSQDKVDILRMDPHQERQQQEALAQMRKRRDEAKTRLSLERLEQGAKGDENLMPLILQAAQAEATTGEICGTMKRVFGEYQPPEV